MPAGPLSYVSIDNLNNANSKIMFLNSNEQNSPVLSIVFMNDNVISDATTMNIISVMFYSADL